MALAAVVILTGSDPLPTIRSLGVPCLLAGPEDLARAVVPLRSMANVCGVVVADNSASGLLAAARELDSEMVVACESGMVFSAELCSSLPATYDGLLTWDGPRPRPPVGNGWNPGLPFALRRRHLFQIEGASLGDFLKAVSKVHPPCHLPHPLNS